MTLTREQAKETRWYYSYPNGFWQYTDQDGFDHLFRDDKELTANIKVKCCFVYPDGGWEYTDEDGNEHFISNQSEPKN